MTLEAGTVETEGEGLTYVTPALATPHPTQLHSGIRLGRYYGMHAMSVVFPMAAGFLLYGWRAVGVVCVVMASNGYPDSPQAGSVIEGAEADFGPDVGLGD